MKLQKFHIWIYKQFFSWKFSIEIEKSDTLIINTQYYFVNLKEGKIVNFKSVVIYNKFKVEKSTNNRTKVFFAIVDQIFWNNFICIEISLWLYWKPQLRIVMKFPKFWNLEKVQVLHNTPYIYLKISIFFFRLSKQLLLCHNSIDTT